MITTVYLVDSSAGLTRQQTGSKEQVTGVKVLRYEVKDIVPPVYVGEFGKLAKTSNTLIIPGNVADLASMVTTAMTALQKTGRREG